MDPVLIEFARGLRGEDLLRMTRMQLMNACIVLSVPHKVEWIKYEREELIQKLKDFIWTRQFD